METQNLEILFDYSWFLAKNLAHAKCRIMKFHYQNSSTVDPISTKCFTWYNISDRKYPSQGEIGLLILNPIHLKDHYFHISRVLAYVQIGTFIIVLMCTSWFFATFFLQSCLHILGPSAFSLDSIPQDTCCGQRIKQKKKKKQRETWQPKVALKEDSGSLRWLHLMKFSLKIKTEFSKISPIPFHSP